MKFMVIDEVFSKLDNVCFGVVVAKGIDNTGKITEIDNFLKENTENAWDKFKDIKVKEYPKITPYRNAFIQLGYNPNKFLCSVEALISRIAKGGHMPDINNIVNLVNAISIKYVLPMGAHDMDCFSEDICIRFSNQNDKFIPFGMNEEESVDPGELVYASGSKIKTRKWIWRQSEQGKVTEDSRNIFFPIDGFIGINDREVRAAVDELKEFLSKLFDCEIHSGFVDKNNPSVEL